MPQRARWSDADLAEAIAAEHSWRGVMLRLGYATASGSGFRLVKASTARLELDTSHFHLEAWNKGVGQGRDPQKDRDAKKRWYDNNRDVYLERNRRRREEIRQEIRRAKEVPCADCGNSFPYYVMDFDHREGEIKLFEVSTGIFNLGRSAVLAEVAKCDVICANCHRIRTATRGGWAELSA